MSLKLSLLKSQLKKSAMILDPTYRNSVRALTQLDALQARITEQLNELAKFYQMDSVRALTQLDALQARMIEQSNELAKSHQMNALCQQLDEYLRPQRERFSDHYEYWRAKRVTAIVEHYGEAWFAGKKILELGCGYGDIGHVFMTLGADVTFAEGRMENCDFLRRRFPANQVYYMNCENEWPFSADAHFDLILHMGLLYHLDNLWFVLGRCFSCCDHMILETEVSDSDDPDFILKTEEHSEHYDQSLIGRGSRPSGACVEKHIRTHGWQYERVMDSRCNARFHIYDWEVKNTRSWRDGLRRFWFCKKGEIAE